MISVLVNKMVAIGTTEEQTEEILGLSAGRLQRQLVQQVSHIDHLLSKDWFLLETKPEHPFFVSDNQVVLKNCNDFGLSDWPYPAYYFICPCHRCIARPSMNKRFV